MVGFREIRWLGDVTSIDWLNPFPRFLRTYSDKEQFQKPTWYKHQCGSTLQRNIEKKKSLINYWLLQDNMSRQADSASFYASILGIALSGPETNGLHLPAPALRIHEGRCQGLAWQKQASVACLLQKPSPPGENHFEWISQRGKWEQALGLGVSRLVDKWNEPLELSVTAVLTFVVSSQGITLPAAGSTKSWNKTKPCV